MDPGVESEVGGIYGHFNMQNFLLSSEEDQLKFLTLSNPCHASKTAFQKRLWADQLLRFLKVVASASIAAALETLECRIPDKDEGLNRKPEGDNKEDEDEGEKRVNSAEEEQEIETTEGENVSLEEIDVTFLRSLCRLLDEWEDAKLKHHLTKRNVISNDLTGISPIKLKTEEAEEDGTRLPTKGRQDGIQEAKANLPENDTKKSDKKPLHEKSPASVHNDRDSKPEKPTVENTKPVCYPNFECLYTTIFCDDPKPYSKPLILGINLTSKPLPSTITYTENSVSGKYNNSPPISPQTGDSGKFNNSIFSPSPLKSPQTGDSGKYNNSIFSPSPPKSPQTGDSGKYNNSIFSPSPPKSPETGDSGKFNNSIFSPSPSKSPQTGDSGKYNNSIFSPSPPISQQTGDSGKYNNSIFSPSPPVSPQTGDSGKYNNSIFSSSPPVSPQTGDSGKYNNSIFSSSPPISPQTGDSGKYNNSIFSSSPPVSPQTGDSGKYNNSIFPPSPPISPQNSVSGKDTNPVLPPSKSTSPTGNDIRTGYNPIMPISLPIYSTLSRPLPKVSLTTPVLPAHGQQYTWVSEHQRKGHYVNAYYRQDGTYVKGHYRQGTTVKGHLRKI